MTRLTWSSSPRTFETGLDHGVLYPKNATAVPWHGLLGVDETGAEESAIYYMDGRPYLHVPKPKEYQATLRAYTYPDELSALMGVAEATDGMYLDSQTSDSFNLSYRTLVGDGVRGTEAGYKIHLVYNATVDPSSVAYGTIGGSADPIEFSWDIKAVPVAMPGFRPTAHVIIDTRHMDPEMIAQIEDFLYGTASEDALIPDPQVIYDTLNHGDEVIITDLGNGEWEAQGSYKNVYLIEDGVFEINNVNGQDNGDGTFTISSST